MRSSPSKGSPGSTSSLMFNPSETARTINGSLYSSKGAKARWEGESVEVERSYRTDPVGKASGENMAGKHISDEY